jgi:type II secretory pathway component PulC
VLEGQVLRGVRIEITRPGGRAAALGLNSGIIVLSVNTITVNSPETAARALEALAIAPSLVLEVEEADGRVGTLRADLCIQEAHSEQKPVAAVGATAPPEPQTGGITEVLALQAIHDERGIGVVVTQLLDGALLYREGLRRGDVIRGINGEPLSGPDPDRLVGERLGREPLELLVTDPNGREQIILHQPNTLRSDPFR